MILPIADGEGDHAQRGGGAADVRRRTTSAAPPPSFGWSPTPSELGEDPALRPDLAIIAEHVAPGARALDIGCGDGALMAALRDTRSAQVRGIEIDAGNVSAAVARGLSVVQGDADTDLATYPDGAFDVAILSQTLQTTRTPDRLLSELLRIGDRAFVSFPNFGYWRVRWSLLWSGRMPVTPALPVSWYETENIHQLTIEDFRTFVAERGVAIEGEWFLAGGHRIGQAGANWRAEHAVFLLRG